MKFTEYIVLEKPGAFMDPLGFLKPYTALQDLLFKQFTVLSNHPAYHGLMSCIYKVLSDKGSDPGKKGFSKDFRDLEILWGVINSKAGESILNITKYKPLTENSEISLGNIPKTHSIYSRLNYGTLGHYSIPSILWGILEKGGVKLTDFGVQLGKAYDTRDGISLSKWFDRWSSNEKISLDNDEIIQLSKLFNIKVKPSESEQTKWQQIIKSYCQRYPRIKCLWDDPFSEDELSAFKNNSLSYQGFFPNLKDKYPSLSKEIELIRLFESLSALVQFFFEREYLTCHYKTEFNAPYGQIEANLGNSLKSLSSEYVQMTGYQDAKSLFRSLSCSSNSADLPAIIVNHHVIHQTSKRVSPFIEEGKLLVKDKVSRNDFANLLEHLAACKSNEAQLSLINYSYRRDWHFARTSLYSNYAGGHV
jgi:hypothetical protein